jgi:hypothetical protein
MMTAEQTELFHLSLLRVLDRNSTSFGLGTNALCILVNEFGFNPSADQVKEAMEYMEDPAIGFVTTVQKGAFNPTARTWKKTALGTNELRKRGF